MDTGGDTIVGSIVISVTIIFLIIFYLMALVIQYRSIQRLTAFLLASKNAIRIGYIISIIVVFQYFCAVVITCLYYWGFGTIKI